MSNEETVPFIVALVIGLVVFFALLSTSGNPSAQRVTGMVASTGQGLTDLLFFGAVAVGFLAVVYVIIWAFSSREPPKKIYPTD